MIVGALFAIVYEHSNPLGPLGKAMNLFASLNPHDILLIFLPALIFESAFMTNFHIFWREIWQALMLGGPGVVIATGLTAVMLKAMYPAEWSWPACFMFGSAISATDPVAVVAILRELGVSKRLATLIEAESLLNDGTASSSSSSSRTW